MATHMTTGLTSASRDKSIKEAEAKAKAAIGVVQGIIRVGADTNLIEQLALLLMNTSQQQLENVWANIKAFPEPQEPAPQPRHPQPRAPVDAGQVMAALTKRPDLLHAVQQVIRKVKVIGPWRMAVGSMGTCDWLVL